MYHFHVSPKNIRKYPWIGIVVGIIGMLIFTFITYVAARDFVNFYKQKLPEIIDVENLKPDELITRKWVTLTNFTLDCSTVEQTKRSEPLDKWIEGQVYDTYVLIRNNSGNQLIVVVFQGDVSCQNFQNQPLTGILTTSQDFSYGLGYSSTTMSKTTTARLILRPDEGPMQSLVYLVLGSMFDAFFLSIIIIFGQLWLGKREIESE